MTDPPDGQEARPTRGSSAAVAAGSSVVTNVAVDVLERGGNAVDAALAAAVCQGVVEFPAGGLGGDAFLLIRSPDGGVVALNGSGAAPIALEPGPNSGTPLPRFGPMSVAVPGFVDAISAAHNGFATWPLSELLAPAIACAHDGFPLSHHLCAAIDRLVPQLDAESPLAALLNDNPSVPGEVFVQPQLATTLDAIADGGREAFYSGPIAGSLTSHVQRRGGLLSLSDMTDHSVDFEAPMSTQFRGASVYTHPPVSLGAILLQELRLYERLGIPPLQPDDAARIDAMVRCKHAAFADLIPVINDGPGSRTQVEKLLTDAHLDARSSALLATPLADLAAGTIAGVGNDTTCLAVTDAHGLSAVLIHSLFNEFGSREFDPETGILLNDRLANQILGLEPNQITGGRRPRHTLNAFIVERSDGRSVVAGATPGGRGQVQTNLQFIVNLIDCSMDLQAAIDAPRWLSGAPRRPEPGDQLYVEESVSASALDELRHLGHEAMAMGAADAELFGSLVVVGIDESGSMIAAADRRRDATAAAL